MGGVAHYRSRPTRSGTHTAPESSHLLSVSWRKSLPSARSAAREEFGCVGGVAHYRSRPTRSGTHTAPESSHLLSVSWRTSVPSARIAKISP